MSVLLDFIYAYYIYSQEAAAYAAILAVALALSSAFNDLMYTWTDGRLVFLEHPITFDRV